MSWSDFSLCGGKMRVHFLICVEDCVLWLFNWSVWSRTTKWWVCIWIKRIRYFMPYGLTPPGAKKWLPQDLAHTKKWLQDFKPAPWMALGDTMTSLRVFPWLPSVWCGIHVYWTCRYRVSKDDLTVANPWFIIYNRPTTRQQWMYVHYHGCDIILWFRSWFKVFIGGGGGRGIFNFCCNFFTRESNLVYMCSFKKIIIYYLPSQWLSMSSITFFTGIAFILSAKVSIAVSTNLHPANTSIYHCALLRMNCIYRGIDKYNVKLLVYHTKYTMSKVYTMYMYIHVALCGPIWIFIHLFMAFIITAHLYFGCFTQWPAMERSCDYIAQSADMLTW